MKYFSLPDAGWSKWFALSFEAKMLVDTSQEQIQHGSLAIDDISFLYVSISISFCIPCSVLTKRQKDKKIKRQKDTKTKKNKRLKGQEESLILRCPGSFALFQCSLFYIFAKKLIRFERKRPHLLAKEPVQYFGHLMQWILDFGYYLIELRPL